MLMRPPPVPPNLRIYPKSEHSRLEASHREEYRRWERENRIDMALAIARGLPLLLAPLAFGYAAWLFLGLLR